MTTALNVINIARSQVGYHEQGNNHTKYWAELDPGLQGSAWCAAFASWCFIHAGHRLPNMGASFGYTSAATAMNWAKSHGYWSTSGRYSPADLLIFGNGEHTAICVSDDGRTLHHIDGNWNDQVSSVISSHSLYLSGAIKASRMLSGIPSQPAVPARPGTHNIAQTKSIQAAVHLTADGAWGGITTHAATVVFTKDLTGVKYLQSRVGVVADGIWGNVSEAARVLAVKRIQIAIGAAPDGVWGTTSKAKWAIALNNNRL